MNDLETKLAAVQRRIQDAATTAGREAGSVALLAVTKAQPIENVVAAWRAGITRFGANYLSEGLAQIAAAPHAEWHFIGRLQSNKSRVVAERFAWVHSVDRDAIARRLAIQRPASLPPLNVLIQVNVDDEASKGGVAIAALPALAAAIARESSLSLRGLMAIPKPDSNIDMQRHTFATVRAAFESLRSEHPNLDTLSMGMSSDLEAAILEGATVVRIGTALFGGRQ